MDEDRIVIESNHLWATDLDWSGVTTRTVHMSLPLNRPATGAPVITGPATVGKVLTVDVTGIEDEDGLHDVEYTYQWVRVDADGTSNEEDITDATADTYTLTDDDLGKKVKIEVSFPDDFGSDEQRTSAPTETVAGAPNTPATGAPTITGTAQVGQTLTAVTTGIMDADGLTSVSYSYQWIRVDADGTSNPADITDETDATYTLGDADLGTTLKVRVTFADDARPYRDAHQRGDGDGGRGSDRPPDGERCGGHVNAGLGHHLLPRGRGHRIHRDVQRPGDGDRHTEVRVQAGRGDAAGRLRERLGAARRWCSPGRCRQARSIATASRGMRSRSPSTAGPSRRRARRRPRA